MASDELARDVLEPPAVATRALAWIGFGSLIFIAVAIAALGLFYRDVVGQRPHPSVRPFPEPRLETSIDPRAVPASGPGPVEAHAPHPVKFNPPLLQRAMQIVAARGPHAYDPPAETAR